MTNRAFCLKVAVVGCGYWGSKHVRILSCLRGVAEVAVVDVDVRRLDEILAAFSTVRVFTEMKLALPHVDALIICTPPSTHAELGLAALQSGKHVLIEKPLATTLPEAQLLVEEARQSKSVLMVGHTFEFNPAVRELKYRVDQGELGRIYYMHSARLNLGMYRADVSVVWDLAAHDVSIMNYLLDSVPSAVAAWGSTNAWAGVEDLAYIRLEYEERGVTGYAHVSWLDPNKTRVVTVVGSKKMAVYDDMREERLRIFDRGVEGFGQDVAPFERPLTYRYGDIVSPYIPFQEPLFLELQHFIDCIRSGAIPQTDGCNGLAVVAVLEAIDESVKTGRTVKVHCPTALDPILDDEWSFHSLAGVRP